MERSMHDKIKLYIHNYIVHQGKDIETFKSLLTKILLMYGYDGDLEVTEQGRGRGIIPTHLYLIKLSGGYTAVIRTDMNENELRLKLKGMIKHVIEYILYYE